MITSDEELQAAKDRVLDFRYQAFRIKTLLAQKGCSEKTINGAQAVYRQYEAEELTEIAEYEQRQVDRPVTAGKLS
jgi:hypothetical protein